MLHNPYRTIQAVTVNHNASTYMELALRSLYARHSGDLDLSIKGILQIRAKWTNKPLIFRPMASRVSDLGDIGRIRRRFPS